MTAAPTVLGGIIAFAAGAVSFLSPCVLPLVPGYLSYASGVSVDDLHAGAAVQTGRVLIRSVVFVIGFAVVFVALGVTASVIGSALAAYRPLLNQIAGVFIVAMGLSMLGVLRLRALAATCRLPVSAPPRGLVGALMLGGAFAFAWIPCIGPILASILAYAGTLGTVQTGALLLFVYTLGLGLPFVITGVVFTRAMGTLQWLRCYSRPLEALSGGILTAVGILLLMNKMFYVAAWGQQLFARLGLNVWASF